ncbi:MAG: MFS transporter [Pirellulales bacterium]|nr:MFS transporter [Pirellulales bacterium]
MDDLTSALGSKRSHFRWVVCGLLFFTITLIYMDRQVLGMLKPGLIDQFGWTEKQYGYIVSAFSLAYAFSYAMMGRVMDWIGERKGFLLIVSIWSTAAMAHVFINPLVDHGLPWLKSTFSGAFFTTLTPAAISVFGFCIVRGILGLAEGGNFPGAIKTVGLWHPKSERATATGIFNAGSNTGIILAAIAVPIIVKSIGLDWSAAFFFVGALGVVWLVLWWKIYDRPENISRVSKTELEFIQSDPPDPPVRIPWLSLLGHRQTWAYTVGMFLSAPVWWFYLYWVPGFLYDKFDKKILEMLPNLITIFLMADVGGIAGGGLSSWLIRRGASINAARKTAFLACSLCVLPVIYVARADSIWVATVLIGLAAAAHQGYAANLFTIVSDTVPRKAVSSVVGIGGAASGVGMFIFTTVITTILDATKKDTGNKDYLVPFIIASSVYLVATAVIHLLLPRLQPMKFDEAKQ